MFIHKPPRYRSSEITPRHFYDNRRRLLAAMGITALSPALPLSSARAGEPLAAKVNPDYSMAARGYDELTPQKKAQAYNNFYELGTQKEDPSENAHLYQPQPWQIEVSGAVNKPRVFDVDDLAKLAPMEERVYRLRCVERWSMVIPWLGIPFKALVDAVEPSANCKCVKFITFNPDKLFPEDANRSLPWPYVEALRLDEAMHPLTLMVFGMYGEKIPTQNGAPMRIIVPWKYGFKSAKAMVRIVFTDYFPKTTWNRQAPREYGFYANVNPMVDHPRWSQAMDKVIDDSFLISRRPTAMFNGFPEVASLYDGMDLRRNF